jgi:DNA-binding NtrC family response regulator
MLNLIALIDRESKDWIQVEPMLEALNYEIRLVQTLEELQTLIEKTGCRVVILDLDMVAVRNRFFRSLKRGNPHLNILATSCSPFHPELKEALTHHICACFRKPLEADEIAFWLKTVTGDEPNARDPTDETWG